MKNKKPVILLLDLETAPLLGSVWGLFEQNLSLSMINKDWHLLSYACKYYKAEDGTLYGPHNKVMYGDQKNSKNIEDDKPLLKKLWDLVNSADILMTQNGVKFDYKKLNSRFLLNGLPPTSQIRHLDSLKIVKKHFSLTSNKLEYLTGKLCTRYKKQSHKKYPGFELWRGCLAGDEKAWIEMKKYNIYDILSLEELFHKLSPWDNSINFNVYHDQLNNICTCGSKKFIKKGYAYTNTGRFQRFKCSSCGRNTTSKVNLLSKEKKASLRKS